MGLRHVRFLALHAPLVYGAGSVDVASAVEKTGVYVIAYRTTAYTIETDLLGCRKRKL